MQSYEQRMRNLPIHYLLTSAKLILKDSFEDKAVDPKDHEKLFKIFLEEISVIYWDGKSVSIPNEDADLISEITEKYKEKG